MYSEDLEEDTPFFYNLKFSDAGELILGSGEYNEHFNLSITNKFMLPNLVNKGVFHVDGTYKILF